MPVWVLKLYCWQRIGGLMDRCSACKGLAGTRHLLRACIICSLQYSQGFCQSLWGRVGLTPGGYPGSGYSVMWSPWETLPLRWFQASQQTRITSAPWHTSELPFTCVFSIAPAPAATQAPESWCWVLTTEQESYSAARTEAGIHPGNRGCRLVVGFIMSW